MFLQWKNPPNLEIQPSNRLGRHQSYAPSKGRSLVFTAEQHPITRVHIRNSFQSLPTAFLCWMLIGWFLWAPLFRVELKNQAVTSGRWWAEPLTSWAAVVVQRDEAIEILRFNEPVKEWSFHSFILIGRNCSSISVSGCKAFPLVRATGWIGYNAGQCRGRFECCAVTRLWLVSRAGWVELCVSWASGWKRVSSSGARQGSRPLWGGLYGNRKRVMQINK